MNTVTPSKITKQIEKLISKISPGQKALYLQVQPGPEAVAQECFDNVRVKVESAGGSVQYGWLIWEWPHVFLEAEFHAVWQLPEGSLADVTPSKNETDRTLFVPSKTLVYKGRAIDNVRLALRDDLLITDFIEASKEKFVVIHEEGYPEIDGNVLAPANRLNPLNERLDLLGKSLAQGLRSHDPCLCGSGKKYKKCHARRYV
ncbi:MAG: SEC-C domain-containing protein [Paenalcaligenes sp.]